MVSTTIGVYLNGQLVRGGRGASSPKGRAHGLDLDGPGHSISFCYMGLGPTEFVEFALTVASALK